MIEWDLATGKERKRYDAVRITPGALPITHAIEYTRDGKWMIVGGGEAVPDPNFPDSKSLYAYLWLFDRKTGKVEKTLVERRHSYVRRLLLSPDGDRLFVPTYSAPQFVMENGRLEPAPGVVIDLCELKLVVGPAGNYQLLYDRASDTDEVGGIQPVNLLGKLSTGKLELVVEDRAAFTAWGKEVNGLQAGLGYRPGERRTYSTGETAMLVLNVGKDDATLKYSLEHYYRNPPAVSDGKGVAVALKGANALLLPRLEEVTLKAGKEIDLCVVDVKLRSPKVEPDGSPWTLHGVGKFHIQYPMGVAASFSPLPGSGLATGKLELEVRDGDKLPLVGNIPPAKSEVEPALKVITLKQVDAADLAKVLAPLFKDAKITADPRTKSLVVLADAKTFELLTALTERLDRPVDQEPVAPNDPKGTFLKRPEEAKLNVASSPRFDPRVFVYPAEPISGTVADHKPDAQEVLLDVGLKDGVRFGHAFRIVAAESGEWVAVAKVMELDGNGKRCIAKVVSLRPDQASKPLKGLAAVTGASSEKNKVAIETHVGKNVWLTESLENKIIRGLLDAAGPDVRIRIVQESGSVERKE